MSDQQPPSTGERPGSGQQPMFGGPARVYPQQELLPQDIQPGRSRLGWIIALVVVIVLIGAGFAGWLILRDDGESGRAAYCSTLKKLIPGNDLLSAVGNGQASSLDQLHRLTGLAPSAVAGDWKTLASVASTVQGSSSQPDSGTFLSALGAIEHIVSDANDHCGMSLTLPLR